MSASSACSPRTIPRSSSSPRKKIACWCRKIRISGRCSRFGKRPARLSSSFAACRIVALPLSSRCCWQTSHLSRLTLKRAPWWLSSQTASECADCQCSPEASVAFVQAPTLSDGAEHPDASPLAKADQTGAGCTLNATHSLPDVQRLGAWGVAAKMRRRRLRLRRSGRGTPEPPLPPTGWPGLPKCRQQSLRQSVFVVECFLQRQ